MTSRSTILNRMTRSKEAADFGLATPHVLFFDACNNYMYSSLCLRNGKIRSPLNPKSVKSRSVKSRVDCIVVTNCNCEERKMSLCVIKG